MLPYSPNNRGYFQSIVGFEEPDLQPSLLNRFAMSLCIEWFIHSKKLVTMLHEHTAVGAHTSIVLIEPSGDVTRYSWSHVALRPLGQPTPVQCQKCLSLQPWAKPKVKFDKGELASASLFCKHCSHHLSFERDSGGHLIRAGKPGHFDDTAKGEWFYELISPGT